MGGVHRLAIHIRKTRIWITCTWWHREVYSSKLCKYLIFKQLGNIKFPKKDSKIKGRMLFFASKRKEPKEKYIFSLLYFFNALQVELVVGKKRLG